MMEKEVGPEVSTSSAGGDTYPTPIALGFYQDEETEGGSIAGAPALLIVENEPEIEQNSSLILTTKDVRDSGAVRGRCGLYNLGNTCFMNSGLQCLLGTIPLVTFFLDYVQNDNTFDHTLLGQFKFLFAKVWSGQFVTIHPKDFKHTLGIYCSQFQDYRQHDCQEFLALLLDSLHEQLNIRQNSTNQNTDAEPCGQKQPIIFEHNIIRGASAIQHPVEDFHSSNQFGYVGSTHTTLTFDNMKSSKDASDIKKVSSTLDTVDDGLNKNKSRFGLASFTVNQISEDSNHSSVSEHSSESDQCTVIQNLKLRSSPVVSQSSDMFPSKCQNLNASKDQYVSSSVDKVAGLTDKTEEIAKSFKRVHSLQDLKTEGERHGFDKDVKMFKAYSDNNLVKKASGDMEATEFEPFEDVETSSSANSSAECDNMRTKEERYHQNSASMSEPVLLNNAISTTSVPSIEDLYSKETKTLNTNVLSSEFIDSSIAVDSEKFAKHENTSSRPEVIEEEDLSNVIEATSEKPGPEHKRIKDVNIRANKKSRSQKGACGSSSVDNLDKEDCFTVNSVKRMKFEGTEKNLQMQEMSKIQKKRLIFGDLRPNRNEINNTQDEVMMEVGGAREVYSDSDSEVGDGRDLDMETTLSDEEDKNISQSRGVMALEGPNYTASEVLVAEESWQKYLSRNDSVIVNTFQGQFKSTVVCSECDRVSVTFEPFMYLSVPIPHAMERQLCVTFMSLSAPPTQYLLVLHKQDKVQKAKEKLCNLIGRQDCVIIMAEVLNWHIARVLEDHTMLRYINDHSRGIYAFEMDNSLSAECFSEDISTSVAQTLTSSSSQDSLAVHGDVFSQMGSFSVGSSTYDSQTSFGSHEYSSHNNPSAMSDSDLTDYQSDDFKVTSGSAGFDIMGTSVWEINESGKDQHRESLETESGGEWPHADSTTAGNTLDDDDNSASTATAEQGENSVSSTSAPVMEDWKSCAICLEELTDNELMVHTSCGGTFCPTCLEMSVQHYRDSCYCCPVCSTPADIADDFVPLASAANHKPKTRIVTVPVSYRCESGVSGQLCPFLFAHPSLLNLPSSLSGEYVYNRFESILAGSSSFRVLLTDGQGLHCSRCLYMEHCTGCEVPRDGSVILRPGDHLTISMETITEEQICKGQLVHDHQSMKGKRSNQDTTLVDCFTAFTQSEELDDNNPWFCPHCKENRRAKKTMTVWQYPDTLIIHLKRFLFHELSSTKVDTKVVFPTDNLDLNEFISGPKTKGLHYNLYSIVCHFGGANCGHYTAYARHPVDGHWYYYNDETVSLQSPGAEEYSSTYVLFYQRRGTDMALDIADDLDLGMNAVDGTSHPQPSILFSPLEREITLDIQKPVPSTSCNEVAPSAGSLDLVTSASGSVTNETFSCDQRTESVIDSSFKGAEKAEADSTDVCFDFYS